MQCAPSSSGLLSSGLHCYSILSHPILNGTPRRTWLRLYFVYALMALRGLTDVFHMENDNMLYVDVAEVKKAARHCGLQIGAEARNLFFPPKDGDRQFIILGTCYFRDAQALGAMVENHLKFWEMGKDRARAAMKGEMWINDMSLSAQYVSFAGAVFFFFCRVC